MLSFEIRLYSILKSKLQTPSVHLDIREGSTVGEALDRACGQYPVMAPYRSVMRMAVNQTYALDSSLIQDGDELAIITPVSGG